MALLLGKELLLLSTVALKGLGKIGLHKDLESRGSTPDADDVGIGLWCVKMSYRFEITSRGSLAII